MATKRNLAKRITAAILSVLLFAGTLGDCPYYVKAEGTSGQPAQEAESGGAQGMEGAPAQDSGEGEIQDETNENPDGEESSSDLSESELENGKGRIDETAGEPGKDGTGITDETAGEPGEQAGTGREPREEDSESKPVKNKVRTLAEQPSSTDTPGEQPEHKHKPCAEKECNHEKPLGVHQEQVWQPWNGKTAITDEGYYYLTEDVTITRAADYYRMEGSHICLNGHVINVEVSGRQKGPTMCIGKSKNANNPSVLTDCSSQTHKFSVDPETGLWTLDEENGTETLTGGCITGARNGENGDKPYPAILVEEEAMLEIYRINIVGNKNSGKTYDTEQKKRIGYGGSAVFVQNKAFLYMYSGKIIGNYMDMSMVVPEEGGWGEKEFFEIQFGACVCVDDGDTGGIFDMYGGEITKNGGANNTCGGVLNRGMFQMYGGKISENSGRTGGGIFNRGTVFEIRGGEIANNHASIRGGGICHYATGGYIKGGTISQNTAKDGGGVYLGKEGSGIFTIEGGTITQNKAENGGGVFLYSAERGMSSTSLEIKGGTIKDNYMQTQDNQKDIVHEFPNNLYLDYLTDKDYNRIMISKDGITEGTEIGVTASAISAYSPRTFTRSASSDYSVYFKSDDPAYKISEKSDHSLELTAEDEALAEVKQKIDLAGKATLKIDQLVQEARTAYDALSEEQKGKLNYAVVKLLEDTETKVWFHSKSIYGAGTKDKPYQLVQDSQIGLLAEYMRTKKDSLKGKYFQLRTDVCTGVEKIEDVIGKVSEDEIIPFAGYFDGMGHTIGIKITAQTVNGTGFFAHNKGIIQNLNLSGEISSGNMDYAGGIAGKNEGQILNCTSLVKTGGKDYVGGIAGSNCETGVINGCVNTENITGTGTHVGAIAGENKGIISECSYRKTTDINAGLWGAGGTQEDGEGIASTDTIHVHTECGETVCSADGEHKNHPDTNLHVWEPWSEKYTFPKEPGYYCLTTDVTGAWVPQQSINLCLNGHIIKGQLPGPIITNKKELVLTDCSSTVHKFSALDNQAWSLSEEHGTEELTGGCITGAFGTDGCAVKNDSDLSIYHINIVGNVAHAPDGEGAGLKNMQPYGNEIKMYSGTIIGNWAVRGAGVYNEKSFIMYGGTIARNQATEVGGGIFCSRSAPELCIYGGKIIDNVAKRGGGIFSGDGSDGSYTGALKVVVADAEITGNRASENGAGIYIGICPLQVAGSPRIYENFVVDENNKERASNVYLFKELQSTHLNDSEGTLNKDARIGITVDQERLEQVDKSHPLKLGFGHGSWWKNCTDTFISDLPGYQFKLQWTDNGQISELFYVVEDPAEEAEAVKNMIEAIGQVTLENVLDKSEAIESAREAYDKLDEEQKKLIPEDVLKKLTDAEELYQQAERDNQSAADQAMEKIDAIPNPVTYDTDCREKIEEARKTYDSLTSAQKKLVKDASLQKLTDAEAAYDKLAADAVIEKINAIGTVNQANAEEKLPLIEAARNAYNSLDPDQKKLIAPEELKKLTDAEKAYDQAAGGKNQEAAERASAKIDAIPSPVQYDWKCAQKIEEAREAYDSLTNIQKSLVSEEKKQKLIDAEREYDSLAAEHAKEKIDAIGSVTPGTVTEKKQEIEEAREAYDALTDQQKELLTEEDKKKLTDAEKEYDQAAGGSDQKAADKVSEKIDAIPSPIQDNEDAGQKIEDAKDAYDNLTGTQKDMVPEEDRKKLEDAKDAYDKMQADKVSEKIDAIGSVTPETVTEKKQEIEEARDAYEKLTEDQKELVTPEDKKKLTDAEKLYDQTQGGKDQQAADLVKGKIDAIPDLVEKNETCKEKIEEAREAYDKLTGTQKDMVPESSKKKLEQAEKSYDRLAAAEVMEKIDALGEVNIENAVSKKDLIEEAREAYDKLTEDQKELIAPVEKKKLTDAEKTYDEATGGHSQEAADQVQKKIDAIPDPVQNNEDTRQKIEEAREAYDKLTSAQKDMVPESSRKKLEQAEKEYDKLTEADRLAAEEVKKKINAIGEVTPENVISKKELIEEAREAYDELSKAQKNLIEPSDKKKLTDAEKIYDDATGGHNQAAADKVTEKIDAIPAQIKNDEETKQKIEDAKDAYDKLTGTQKDMVPEDSKKKLEEAEEAYNKLAAEEVRKKIEAIGEVTPENVISKKDLIEEAREAYDELSKAQKDLIEPSDKKKLTDAEKIYDDATGGHNQAAADKVTEKIDAIPDQIKNDEETKQKIEDAKDAYDKLTGIQKDMVPEDSRKKLEEAEEAYKKLVTDDVQKKIEAIGEVTPENVISKKDLIEDAREAYDKLTEDQKKLIEPEEKKKLTDAEKIYDDATGGHNQAAADKVTEKIDAIPDQIKNDEETKQKIEDAEDAYDNLTGTQKDMVPEDSKKKLEEAEKEYNRLVTDEVKQKIEAIGEVTPENVISKKDLIEEAREAYDKLTEAQKDLINSSDRKKLTDAEKIYNDVIADQDQAVNRVKEKIDAIGEIIPENAAGKKQLIEDARTAYDALDEGQKKLISPSEKKKLTDAEKIYDTATGGKNQAAADQAKQKIDAIPNPVTGDWDVKTKIEEARKAYDNLTSAQKDMVPEVSKKKLEDAEKTYRSLVSKADEDAVQTVLNKINAIGKVVKTDACGKKIKDARSSYNLLTVQQKKLFPPAILKKLADAEKTYADLNKAPSLPPEKQKQIEEIADKLGVSKKEAEEIQKVAEKLGVDPETLLVTDKTITGMKSEEDVKGAAYGKLQVKGTKVSDKKFTLKWKKLKGADGYLVYGTRCGKGRKPKLLKTLKKSSQTSLTVKKLKKGTPYRYIVRAYKQVGKKKITIAVAKTVHIFTTGGKYTNAKSVKVNKAKVTVKKGKKFKLKGKEVKVNKKKKIRQHRVVCYESTNNKIATVTKKGGVIKGKKKGTCKIYVYTQNGIYKTVKVTVK